MSSTTDNKRRGFVKAGLIVPLLTTVPWAATAGYAMSGSFIVPDKIYQALFHLYGGDANVIMATDKISIKAPFIAENGAVVPCGISGEKGLVTSLAVFVEKNEQPLVTHCRLHAGTDLDVALRIRVRTSSDVYAVVQANDGMLYATKTQVKITIGCGGG